MSVVHLSKNSNTETLRHVFNSCVKRMNILQSVPRDEYVSAMVSKLHTMSDAHTPEAIRTDTTSAEKQHHHNGDNFFSEIVRFALIAFIIVVPLRVFIAAPFIVQGASMLPTFESGEYLIVDKFSYHFQEPARGDVIIFRHPDSPITFLIKRIVGLPGETIEVDGSLIRVINTDNPQGFIISEPYIANPSITSAPDSVTLAADEYFVLGDNRGASSDSRVFGALQETFIIGRAFLRLWPFNEAEVFPGDYTPVDTS